MMKNLLMAAVIGAGFLGAQAANYPSVWRTVADGGTVVAARNLPFRDTRALESDGWSMRDVRYEKDVTDIA